MSNIYDIATISTAKKVHLHVNANYYAVQLDALQAEVKRFGYFFAQVDTEADIPPVLFELLAWAMEYQRICYLNPNAPEEWAAWTDSSMSDGNSQERLRAILAALAGLGIRLQEGPNAFAAQTAEECHQRESV